VGVLLVNEKRKGNRGLSRPWLSNPNWGRVAWVGRNITAEFKEGKSSLKRGGDVGALKGWRDSLGQKYVGFRIRSIGKKKKKPDGGGRDIDQKKKKKKNNITIGGRKNRRTKQEEGSAK